MLSIIQISIFSNTFSFQNHMITRNTSNHITHYTIECENGIFATNSEADGGVVVPCGETSIRIKN